MPQQKIITIYDFDELSEPARAVAREWFRSCLEADDYAEYVITDAVRLGGLIGITFATQPVRLYGGRTRQDPSVSWALHVQGAGASFDGRYAYRRGSVQAVAAEAPEQAPSPAFPYDRNIEINRIARELAAVQRQHGYRLTASMQTGRDGTHSRAMTIEVRNEDRALPETTIAAVDQLLREFADWIYHGLEEEYDYRTADATVDEDIRANGYTFTKDGKRA